MTERIEFLRQETLSGRNKIMRRAMPTHSTAGEPGGIPVRKARAFQWICENMPLYIGPRELIVGTRTFFVPHEDNLDSHDPFHYTLVAYPEYVTKEEIDRFGGDYSQVNKQHYTPDFGILLDGGIDGILRRAEEKKKEPGLGPRQLEFLDSVIIAYTGLAALIGRYADHAAVLAAEETGEEAERLLEISRVCRHIRGGRPRSFREAVQLLWFGHLGTMLESSIFINYGRLDVILEPFFDTTMEEGRELIACLLLKMYDQADINDKGYFNKHEGQLVITLGGVLPNGENAAGKVTRLFLEAVSDTMLPEPEINLRLSSRNPAWFLDMAAELTVKGANFMSYYNDDRFVKSLQVGGLDAEDARNYAFDLCQDMNIPGKGDFYVAYSLGMTSMLMDMLTKKNDYESFEELLAAVKQTAADCIAAGMEAHNRDFCQVALYRDGKYDEYFANIQKGANPNWNARSPMCPLPYLSGMYLGAIENATDNIYESYPIKERGLFFGTVVETVNYLAAIK
ncbi:MAG: pyruvate formate lyase family protein, partial [Clostridia bacterium]|nr:pyruvate formate lyase family protein [Clostridia bacterium]